MYTHDRACACTGRSPLSLTFKQYSCEKKSHDKYSYVHVVLVVEYSSPRTSISEGAIAVENDLVNFTLPVRDPPYLIIVGNCQGSMKLN